MRMIIVNFMADKQNQAPAKASAVQTPTPSKVSSETLLGQANELRIVHEGREYRLRRTQNGRLILTA